MKRDNLRLDKDDCRVGEFVPENYIWVRPNDNATRAITLDSPERHFNFDIAHCFEPHKEWEFVVVEFGKTQVRAWQRIK